MDTVDSLSLFMIKAVVTHQGKNGQLFFLPSIIGLKEPYYLPNIAANLFKKTTILPTENII